MLWVFRLGPRVIVHLRCPLKKTRKLFALAEQESPKFQKPDFVHFETGVSLHAPAQVRAPPRSHMMPASRIPQKSNQLPHSFPFEKCAEPAFNLRCWAVLAEHPLIRQSPHSLHCPAPPRPAEMLNPYSMKSPETRCFPARQTILRADRPSNWRTAW